jgi:hypothetical protein
MEYINAYYETVCVIAALCGATLVSCVWHLAAAYSRYIELEGTAMRCAGL